MRPTASNESPRSVSGHEILFTLGSWVMMAALVGTTTYFGLRWMLPQWTGDGPVLTIVAEVYALFLVAAAIAFGGFRQLRDNVHFRYTSLRDVLLGLGVWALAIGASIVMALILSPIAGSLAESLRRALHVATDISRLPNADTTIWLLIVIRACVLVPLAEELLFRGLLFGWLRARLSFARTALITSTLFSVMHVYPVLFPVAFIVGFGAAWVRERTGSSFNFVVAHAANSVTFLGSAKAGRSSASTRTTPCLAQRCFGQDSRK